ncbi:hypothetical protein AVEN_40469-1 [Araneus ventricosus]|uniref:Uncharacterized protein n=1 Tax=Araneus ventricosus TaxID=182803 RepID=A0A4Y2PSU6_ARAVE|nr:hypothetical protein AVEN_40469-1 [Araneus ventricosus]
MGLILLTSPLRATRGLLWGGPLSLNRGPMTRTQLKQHLPLQASEPYQRGTHEVRFNLQQTNTHGYSSSSFGFPTFTAYLRILLWFGLRSLFIGSQRHVTSLASE